MCSLLLPPCIHTYSQQRYSSTKSLFLYLQQCATSNEPTMATAASVTVDLTTYPICFNLFDVPKSLPCLHAFCLSCLQGYFKDKCSGDAVPCPMCRKEFQIPSDGLYGLQHRFFVQQLVDFRKGSSEEFALCAMWSVFKGKQRIFRQDPNSHQLLHRLQSKVMREL